MTYDVIERSTALARPVEIYTFARGSLAWRFTSANRDVVVASNTYAKAIIRRPNIQQGSELNRSAIKLQVPRDFPIAELYQAGIPADTITLRIQQYHEGDGELVGIWGGRVINCARVPGGAEISCEPVFTSVRQLGLRRRYQRQCPHVLYGSGCKLVANSFKLTTTVDSVSGLSVTAAALAGQPDGWWEGGWMQWEIATGVFERRFIFGHTGGTVQLTTQPLGLAAGMEAEFFPGCDHTLATCNDKFSNRDNYGGFPDIPQKNPFGSDPVY